MTKNLVWAALLCFGLSGFASAADGVVSVGGRRGAVTRPDAERSAGRGSAVLESFNLDAMRGFGASRMLSGFQVAACNFQCVKWKTTRTPRCVQSHPEYGHWVCDKWEYDETRECVEWTCGH